MQERGTEAQPPPPKIQAVSCQDWLNSPKVSTPSARCDSLSNLVELAAQSIRSHPGTEGSDQGDRVEPGQLLVVLDQAQLQAQLASDKAPSSMEEESKSGHSQNRDWKRYEYLAKLRVPHRIKQTAIKNAPQYVSAKLSRSTRGTGKNQGH